MSAASAESVLTERLGRLKEGDEGCDLPEYEALAHQVRSSPGFAASLVRIKALSDENRLLCVMMLRRRAELCACELQAATGLTHATVSHHMGVLVAAGIVRSRREGKWMYYSLSNKGGPLAP
jgi:DNA-binding transcriptional ArsR family regulator